MIKSSIGWDWELREEIHHARHDPTAALHINLPIDQDWEVKKVCLSILYT